MLARSIKQKREQYFTRGKLLVALVISVLFVLVVFMVTPWKTGELMSHPSPAKSYHMAVSHIENIIKLRPSGMSRDGMLKFMTHHRKVKNVIVLVHGFTNCPVQFEELGKEFYHKGYNVLIAPLPRHGMANLMTDELARLTAEELIIYGDKMVDIAQGLGEHVTMVGLSAGGNVVAWAAQNRQDLDLAVITAPVFGYKKIPMVITPALTNLCLVLPNGFQWWDPIRKADLAVDHCYPRFATRGLAHTLRLGFAVQKQARQEPPAAGELLVITNANDGSVQKPPIMELVRNWRKHGGNVRTFEFAADLKLGHDLIDPAQPYARVDVVYPRLMELIVK